MIPHYFIAVDGTLRMGQAEHLRQNDLHLDGAEINYQLPGGFWHRIRSVSCSFDAKSQVATRQVRWKFSDGNRIIFMTGVDNGVVANGSVEYSLIAGSAGTPFSLIAYQIVSIPDMWLPPGSRIQTDTINLQSLDRWVGLDVETERIERELFEWYVRRKLYGRLDFLHSSTPPA